MSPVRGPVVPRRRLGAELRALRDQAGLTIEEVAKELECSVSKVSRLETGQGIPKGRDVRDLLDRYGVTDQAYRDRLMRWVRDGQRQGWWHNFSDVLAPDPEDPLLPDNFSRYVALEQDASEVHAFEITVVHGLLQTADYARAVLTTLSTADSDATDRLVELRMRRQDRLYVDEDPLRVHLILDEGALHRVVGGKQVMRTQLKRLVDDAQRSNITIQVLPFSVGTHPATTGPFGVLTFPGSDDNDLVYVEGHLGDLYLEKEHDVEVYERMFDELVDMSMTAEESVAFITAALPDH
ncbi:MAG TPA: helix-turn-helix transcriptional regulator [Pseudonocardiaceae bacterium]|jgi:transcriptional regulator with XRE-family HTH domain|nr:helix-turn-helix transcriptional regulator [Pseudonocardiaceae bacterium]